MTPGRKKKLYPHERLAKTDKFFLKLYTDHKRQVREKKKNCFSPTLGEYIYGGHNYKLKILN